MQFAINRLDMTGAHQFAASAARAEALGWHTGLIPCSPLLARDPYVMLAFAAQTTKTLRLGTLLDTPVIRHPAALASSIATVAELAPGRTLLGLGVGDTAVRLNGLAPARVQTLQTAVQTTRVLLRGETLDVGATRPARLRHAQPVPVWIAAQGPKTLHMAGATCDGVFIRVGRHAGNVEAAYQQVLAGVADAGRKPEDVEIGLIFHTVVCDDVQRARVAAKAVAAGYFEYSKFLFERPGLAWEGPDVDELKRQVWPDFHHAADMEAAGRHVAFLPDRAADDFALYGSLAMIREQLAQAIPGGIPVSTVLPHPIVLPDKAGDGAGSNYLEDFASQVIHHL